MELSEAVVIAIVVLGVFVILHSLLLMGVLRMMSQVYETVFPDQGPADSAGQPVPSFVAETMSGSIIDSSKLKNRLTALLFVSPDCGPCLETLDELEVSRFKNADDLVIICTGDGQGCGLLQRKVSPVEMVHDVDGRLRALFKVKQTPMAVIIGENGRIQSYGAPAQGEIQAVVNQA